MGMTEVLTKLQQKEDKPENWQELKNTIEKLKETPEENTMVTLDATEEFMEMAVKDISENATITKTLDETVFQPRNRAERRALDKATRRQKQKKRRMFADSIKETAEKLAYINMIEKVRELNKQIEEEGVIENEAAN